MLKSRARRKRKQAVLEWSLLLLVVAGAAAVMWAQYDIAKHDAMRADISARS